MKDWKANGNYTELQETVANEEEVCREDVCREASRYKRLKMRNTD